MSCKKKVFNVYQKVTIESTVINMNFFQNLAKINTRKPFKIKSCFSMKYTEKKAIKIDILLARECISKHEEIRYLRF